MYDDDDYCDDDYDDYYGDEYYDNNITDLPLTIHYFLCVALVSHSRDNFCSVLNQKLTFSLNNCIIYI